MESTMKHFDLYITQPSAKFYKNVVLLSIYQTFGLLALRYAKMLQILGRVGPNALFLCGIYIHRTNAMRPLIGASAKLFIRN